MTGHQSANQSEAESFQNLMRSYSTLDQTRGDVWFTVGLLYNYSHEVCCLNVFVLHVKLHLTEGFCASLKNQFNDLEAEADEVEGE